ncbi:hypothetical protein OG894_41485 [Streptomyces sp. NBC_01724]|uniref:hypothetical protein n=1 Tax=unclassified Streptomyces TaxID=2593676 RepID=UPI002E2EEFFE|nr:hypothetical protein [Streptomyces sp. NBC_01724]WTE57284.1 hypothetical protein OG987_00310 [Streptomyces sp. NBC_01620]
MRPAITPDLLRPDARRQYVSQHLLIALGTEAAMGVTHVLASAAVAGVRSTVQRC